MTKTKLQVLLVGGLCALVLTACGVFGGDTPLPKRSTSTNAAYNRYIDRYAAIALESKRQYRIPASITLAQGLLESAAGQSKLARKANNHFGIKCHKSWVGSRTYHDDDRPRECFRAYNSVEESYKDHALFLQQKRYSALFALDPLDYKGWAKGLQRAGYATDKGYANKLIKIIEDNQLYLIDRGNSTRKYIYNDIAKSAPKKQPQAPAQPSSLRPTFIANELLYVEARSGETLADIAREVGITERKLEVYNDLPSGYPLDKGDIVYLQRKHARALPPHYNHRVQVGESIHTIAQTYGVRLRALYRLNGFDDDHSIVEGEILNLR